MGEPRLWVPLEMLLRLQALASPEDAAFIDEQMRANSKRIERVLARRDAYRRRSIRWAYERALGVFMKRRNDLTEAQAKKAFPFTTENARKVTDAYMALLKEEKAKR